MTLEDLKAQNARLRGELAELLPHLDAAGWYEGEMRVALRRAAQAEQLLAEAEGREAWWKAKSGRQAKELANLNATLRGQRGTIKVLLDRENALIDMVTDPLFPCLFPRRKPEEEPPL